MYELICETDRNFNGELKRRIENGWTTFSNLTSTLDKSGEIRHAIIMVKHQ